MSFSNAPDERTLGRVAGGLAVDEAFVEKDWYVVQAIRTMLALDHTELTPVFSGGTALLKGHELIRRFSEDIDFKLLLSAYFEDLGPSARRTLLGQYRDALVGAWTAAGFEIGDVASHRTNAFIQFELRYPTILDAHHSLRPHILVEVSARPPRLEPIAKPVHSFVEQFIGRDEQASTVLCVDPVETAADKLSAFTWRVLSRDRASDKDDPAIVRHLHDLAILERRTETSRDFIPLLHETLGEDSKRAGETVAAMQPRARLDAMLAALAEDRVYEAEYARFVGGMAFAGEPEIPGFATTCEAVRRLVERYDVPEGPSGTS